ncbi:MAG TPA: prenyltransferase [Nocardioidaceae bacterium]|nr:prenyltransferase [Nocardioidaceae bacterium]
MSRSLPHLPGVLDGRRVRAAAAAIAAAQEPSGAIPWFPGGQVDAWDHVECAMALLVGGEPEAARRAYGWLFAAQRPDGSWPMATVAGRVTDPGTDTNMCAYIAVGVWHHWLVSRDAGFLSEGWPVVRRALDLVVAHQLPFGGIDWAVDEHGATFGTALVTGSSSIRQALACGLSLAGLVGEPQPHWAAALDRLDRALREHEDRFDPRPRHAMDWCYPVLAGVLRGPAGLDRIAARWHDFVVPGLGVRCVDDRPWVTGAETCELAIALACLGRRDDALRLLADMQHLHDPDGLFWTGYVFADGARWPEERSTWTAAAVVLAADTLARTTGGADVFLGSGDRVARVAAHPA